MPDLMPPAQVLLISASIFGPLTSWLAGRRRRIAAAWFVFGAILGPIATLLVLAAPPGRCPYCDSPTSGWLGWCPTCWADLPGVIRFGRAPETYRAPAEAHPAVGAALAPAAAGAAGTAGSTPYGSPVDARSFDNEPRSSSTRSSRSTRRRGEPSAAPGNRSSRPRDRGTASTATRRGQEQGHDEAATRYGETGQGNRAERLGAPLAEPRSSRLMQAPGPAPSSGPAPAPQPLHALRPVHQTEAGHVLTTVLGTGVCLAGVGPLLVGGRYVMTREGDELVLTGPVERPDGHVIRRPLSSIDVTLLNGRLMITRRDGSGNLVAAFQSLVIYPGVDLEAELAVSLPLVAEQ